MSKSVVYFIQHGDTVKIGYTAQLKTRVSALRQTFKGAEILGVVEGGYKTEQELHRRFAQYLIPAPNGGISEWFELSDEIRDYIQTHCLREWDEGEFNSVHKLQVSVSTDVYDALYQYHVEFGTPIAKILRSAVIEYLAARGVEIDDTVGKRNKRL
jgi:hypothetical protein